MTLLNLYCTRLDYLSRLLTIDATSLDNMREDIVLLDRHLDLITPPYYISHIEIQKRGIGSVVSCLAGLTM